MTDLATDNLRLRHQMRAVIAEREHLAAALREIASDRMDAAYRATYADNALDAGMRLGVELMERADRLAHEASNQGDAV